MKALEWQVKAIGAVLIARQHAIIQQGMPLESQEGGARSIRWRKKSAPK